MSGRLLILLCLLLPAILYGQGFAISADRMNVAYIGIDNSLSVVAEGYTCDQLEVICSNGTITKLSNCEYNFLPVNEGKADIIVRAKTASGIKQIGVKEFRVNFLPSPSAEIAGKSSGIMTTTSFKVQRGVSAPWHHFGYNASMTVTNFEIVFFREGKLLHSATTSGPYFDRATVSQMVILKPGDKVFITDIKVVGPDNLTRKLNDIELTLN